MPSAAEIRARLDALAVRVTESRNTNGLRILGTQLEFYKVLIPGAVGVSSEDGGPVATAPMRETAATHEEVPATESLPMSVAPVSARATGRAKVPLSAPPAFVDEETA